MSNCKSVHHKPSTKHVSTWSESTISIGSFSEEKHLDNSNITHVNGESHFNVMYRYKSCDSSDAKSLVDSIEDELEKSKSDPENDNNKRINHLQYGVRVNRLGAQQQQFFTYQL